MQPIDAWNGGGCGICNREMKGEMFTVDLVLKNKKVKDAHVAGYQCQKCSVCVCFECMESRFNKANWRNTLCPKCGNSFGPKAILLGNDLDEHIKMVMREQQRSFDSGKVAIPADWKSMLLGVAAVCLGVGISEYLRPPFAALLIIFGVLGVFLGATPWFWSSPKVMLLQAFNSVIIGALCTMLILTAKANVIPVGFFIWVVYRQLSDYLASKARAKERSKKIAGSLES